MKTHGILIIDDEAEILKALKRTLERCGRVYTAISGKTGLDVLTKKEISLIICDQRMPEMTGIEFFKIVREKYPSIIRTILTAYTDIEDLIEAINEVGLYRYITKPWDNRELQLTVKRALERHELESRNRELIEALRKSNQELEKKVESRTRELHTANKKLKGLSVTDELTGVGNRRYFVQQLKSEMERSLRYKHTVSLLMIDLDYFKSCNDRFGHAVGDRVLRAAARTLNTNIRITDFLARYGGEEFAIILPETLKEKAMEMAERLRKAIAQKRFPIGIKKGKAAGLTVSIGLSSYPDDLRSKDPKKLLLHADRALYQAKRKGRNRVEG